MEPAPAPARTRRRARWIGRRFAARVAARLVLPVVALLLVVGCDESGILRGALVVEGAHELGAGSGHVVVLGGTGHVAESASVDGTVVLLGGEVTVAGRVTGDLMLIDGRAVLSRTAVIDGTMVVAGATVDRAPGSVVRGGVQTDLDVLAELARPAPTLGERALTLGVQAILLGAFAWLLAGVASAAVHRVAEAAVRHAAVSGAINKLSGRC